MRRTDRARRRRRAQRRRRRRILITVMILFLVLLCCGAGLLIWNAVRGNESGTLVMEYEQEHYDQGRFRGGLFATDLCVAAQDVIPDSEETDEKISEQESEEPDTDGSQSAQQGDDQEEEQEEVQKYVDTDQLMSAGLFDLNGAQVEYAYNIHKKLYPASVTKIMTALVAIENCDLDETVTVQSDADSDSFAYDEVTIGLKTGDTLTMEDLLYGLLLCSGNDAAVAIADHVAGSTEAFAQMMNDEAARLMATESHFVNANGLQNEDHYTTVYDLYLIFNECIQHTEFMDIISATTYHTEITGSDGAIRAYEWEPSNAYGAGLEEAPEGVTVIGGKTGTTKLAGNCLILLDNDTQGQPYISVIMGADTRGRLYTNMNALLMMIEE